MPSPSFIATATFGPAPFFGTPPATATLSSPIITGDSLLVWVQGTWNSDSELYPTPTLTDSSGNAYTRIASYFFLLDSDDFDLQEDVYWCSSAIAAPSGVTFTVTGDPSTAAILSITALQYRNMTGWTKDTSATNSYFDWMPGSSGTQTVTFTASASGNVSCINAFSEQQNSVTAGAGYVLRSSTHVSSTTGRGINAADRLSTLLGSQTASMNFTLNPSGSGGGAIVAVVLKPPATVQSNPLFFGGF